MEPKLIKIKPLFNAIITTADKYKEDIIQGSLLTFGHKVGDMKPIQRIIAVGDIVHNVKVGDIIHINFDAFGVKKHREGSLKDGIINDNPIIEYKFNCIMIDGKECMVIHNENIDFIIDSYIDEEGTKQVNPNMQC